MSMYIVNKLQLDKRRIIKFNEEEPGLIEKLSVESILNILQANQLVEPVKPVLAANSSPSISPEPRGTEHLRASTPSVIKEEEPEVIEISDSEDDAETDSSARSKSPTISVISYNGSSFEETLEDSVNLDLDNFSTTDTVPTPKGVKRNSHEVALNNSPNRVREIFTLLKLTCIKPGCKTMVTTKEELTDHLAETHKILSNRCLLKGCEESFSNHEQLSQHLCDSHPKLVHYPCAGCEKNFKNYHLLYRHFQLMHQLGEFQCAIAGCGFTATNRSSIYGHNKQAHRTFICPETNCHRVFYEAGNIRRHIRMHARVKPYVCRWENCQYASEFRSTTISHIRVNHFMLPRTMKIQKQMGIVDDRDPRDFLEVKQHLLDALK